MLDQGGAECGLQCPPSVYDLPVSPAVLHTLPAPAGPMTRTPNLDIVSVLFRELRERV